MKLAIAQMVLGVVIAGSSALGLFRFAASEPAAYAGFLSVLLLAMYSCVCISGTLGLAVLGCGVAQFLKARGSSAVRERHGAE